MDMGRLFGCSACAAKDREIARQDAHLRWLQQQLDQQNKRLAEIAAPHSVGRIAAAERAPAPARRIAIDPDQGSADLPGFEPATPPSVELEA
jgi:hypothetical protein